jgi:hypothetical protein
MPNDGEFRDALEELKSPVRGSDNLSRGSLRYIQAERSALTGGGPKDARQER